LQVSTVVSRETVRGRRQCPAATLKPAAGVRSTALLLVLSLLGLLLLSACGGIDSPQGWAAPVAVDNTLLLTLERGKLSAFDQQTSQQTWQFPSKDAKNIDLKAIYGTPVTGGGRVYVGAFDGTFYALDLATGEVVWQQTTGGAIVGGAALVDGTVYVGSSDNRLYAFDAASGDSRWTPFEAQGDIWSTPVVDQGTVYVTSMDHRVYALDAATGQPKWPEPFEAEGAIPSTPALAGDRLYVGALDNRLYALDKATGKVAWSFKTDNWVWCDALVASGVVYVGGLDHHVYALDAATGEPHWGKPFAAKVPIRAQPAMAGGTLVVVDQDGDVYGLDPATGEERWPSIVLGSGVLASPLVMNNEVLMSTRDWKLLRVDAQAGSFSQVAP
jgi:eukaryotic-like serine/threonine-protein kinase